MGGSIPLFGLHETVGLAHGTVGEIGYSYVVEWGGWLYPATPTKHPPVDRELAITVFDVEIEKGRPASP